MARPKSFELLKQHWKSKQKNNPRLSLRFLARKLELSPSYLSKIFSGKKALPLARARALAEVLNFDPVALRALERAIVREQSPDQETRENFDLEFASSPMQDLPSAGFETAESQTALEEWYYLPILDLVTCHGFEPSWISEQLGLKEDVATRAWKRLQELGWVKEKAGTWYKITERIRFPAPRIDEKIQRHHTKMLQKAADELAHRKSPDDFKRRLILGASVATNEASYRKAEKFLEEALFKTAEILSTGRADRVYYCSVQLFPLSRKKNTT